MVLKITVMNNVKSLSGAGLVELVLLVLLAYFVFIFPIYTDGDNFVH